MMPPQTTIVDVVTLITSGLAAVFGLQVAAIWGPYVAILAAAIFGASLMISFASGPPMDSTASAKWMASAVLGSCLFTVALSQLVSNSLHRFISLDVSVNTLLVIVAAVIAGSRGYWVSTASWAWSLVRRKAEKGAE
jgi:hypothetical protein